MSTLIQNDSQLTSPEPRSPIADGGVTLPHSLGFAHGERVPFDGIGVVGEASAHVLPYRGNDIGGKGRQASRRDLSASNSANNSALLFIGFSCARFVATVGLSLE